MKQSFVLLTIFFSFLTSTAQRVVDVNKDNVNAAALVFAVGGEPFSSVKYVKVVDGSPYFNEDWMRGSVILNDSSEYTNLRLRLDLLAGAVEYIDRSGQQMVATSKIREVRLVDSLTGWSIQFIHHSAISVVGISEGWYQKLADGPIALFKRTLKQVQESKPYSSATTEQRITSTEQYYLLTGTQWTRVKKFKDLPELLPNKKTSLQKFIADRKLNGRNIQDYIDVVQYYNQ